MCAPRICTVLNAILYVAEHGCKWRGLPARFGRWQPIYTRMNRWAKTEVLDRVFEHHQKEHLVRTKLEAGSLDSTIVKVHPDGMGARKKNRSTSHRQVPRGMDPQDAFGCRGCAHRGDVLAALPIPQFIDPVEANPDVTPAFAPRPFNSSTISGHRKHRVQPVEFGL